MTPRGGDPVQAHEALSQGELAPAQPQGEPGDLVQVLFDLGRREPQGFVANRGGERLEVLFRVLPTREPALREGGERHGA